MSKRKDQPFGIVSFDKSAEKNEQGQEYLESQQWRKMGTATYSSRASEYLEKITKSLTGDLHGEDLIRVLWLSATLFFVVGGYWLLRSLKDPIMSVINGVEYIPQAKIASLFVVFGLVIVCKSWLFLPITTTTAVVVIVVADNLSCLLLF